MRWKERSAGVRECPSSRPAKPPEPVGQKAEEEEGQQEGAPQGKGDADPAQGRLVVFLLLESGLG